ncbi:sensor histidine kinase [Flammeovirga kamogawensis]|uniref:histidine kinase n=1 Tax=Flammeovirga kamogawensis TaxID=373891 RepID=A0ABX8GR57_9BACT|nr:PAS domain-containing protein [Flammeovirga kamogawensis]MBB6462713.1 PAS domain S-box-containing protein [Flammeovirga kamogawensis]QWG06054.1 PAS domain-containing protein [Flammeovirga kamogawensis]TRX67886.1 PAS domain S-box protein [Flammeovirga kamogawensis]
MNNLLEDKKRPFFWLFLLNILLILGILTSLALLFVNQERLFDSQVNRYNSYRLGDALRQSDDFLTDYCKNFIITKDTIWEKKYWDLVALREGKLILEEQGWSTSILDSMYQMGFSEQEFTLLKEALGKSNQLIKKETQAFNAAKGIFLDSANQYTIKGTPDMDKALQILYDKEYLFTKKEVMEPIVRFESLIESRTQATVEKNREQVEHLLITIFVTIAISVLLSIITYYMIVKRLIQKEQLSNQLQSRNKEQACLYKISQLTESTSKDIKHILESATLIIPYGWQFTEKTCCRITYKESVFTSLHFTKSEWKQEAKIYNGATSIGTIEVFYNDLSLNRKESPFLKEEQELVEAVASLISNFHERKSYLENLSESNKSLKKEIAAKEKTEIALIDKEQQLQFALDVSNEGIWEIYHDSDVINFSERCYSILGFTSKSAELDQMVFWKDLIIDGDQEKALINRIKEIKRSGLHDSIYRIKTKDGQYKWIHTKGKAVAFSAQNVPLRIVGTMSDITERMKQEEKIVDAILETEDKERSRIAREIHDGLQQTMSTSLMSFEKVRSSVDFEEQKIYERFHMGYQYLKKAIEESRTLAHNLMPKVVSDNGIVAAIESLVSAIQPSSATVFNFDQNILENKLKLSVEMTLYRITQEAVNNVIKYANASKCNIQLLKHSDVVLLTIDDNGDGFVIDQKEKTFGINSMRTRAESIGAYFEINSHLNKGTQILVELPLK